LSKAIWEVDLEHIRPELAVALSISESHPDMDRLMEGLSFLAHAPTTTLPSESKIKLTDAIEYAKKLSDVLSRLPEVDEIDGHYYSAFRELEGQYDESVKQYLMDLQNGEDAGVIIFLKVLIAALEKQKSKLPSSAIGEGEKSHHNLYRLVYLAEVITKCDENWRVSKKYTSIYYKYCKFYINRIANDPVDDPIRRIEKAVIEFKKNP